MVAVWVFRGFGLGVEGLLGLGLRVQHHWPENTPRQKPKRERNAPLRPDRRLVSGVAHPAKEMHSLERRPENPKLEQRGSETRDCLCLNM